MSSSLVDGAAQLRSAADFLELSWERSESGWNDSVRERFEVERLDPLRKQLSLVFTSIQQLAETLNAAKRHCADQDRPQE